MKTFLSATCFILVSAFLFGSAANFTKEKSIVMNVVSETVEPDIEEEPIPNEIGVPNELFSMLVENPDAEIETETEPVPEVEETEIPYIEPEPADISIDIDDYELVASIVWLEARGEPSECQKCICDTIYNRVKSGVWGSTVKEVIFAQNQFSTVPYLGTVQKDDIYYSIYDMVSDTFENGASLPARIMYFRADYYHAWAISEFSISRTYFSSSPWIKV